jgi:hypothetical protein
MIADPVGDRCPPLFGFQRSEALVRSAAERDRIGWRAGLKHRIVRRTSDPVRHAHDWVEGADWRQGTRRFDRSLWQRSAASVAQSLRPISLPSRTRETTSSAASTPLVSVEQSCGLPGVHPCPLKSHVTQQGSAVSYPPLPGSQSLCETKPGLSHACGRAHSAEI